ncbi:MAG: STAS domain-containing protein [Bacteroidota bacterium]
MNVKLDTKEKFTVITPEESEITANMTVELQQLLDSFKIKDIPHLVFNFDQVKKIDETTLQMIVQQQQEFYNDNNSFVICGLNETIIKTLETKDCLDIMNITPTESEAWDIVQMEEIERELMKDFDNN